MALDYYDILGVPPKADAGEIRKAYRLLALKWHPDRNPADPWAASRFMQLGEAYRVLRDPVRRAAYDRLRSQEHPPGGESAASSPEPDKNSEPSSAGATSRQGRNAAPGRSRPHRKKPSVPPNSSHPNKSNGSSRGLATWRRALKALPHRFLNWLKGRSATALDWEMVPTPGRPDLVMILRLPKWLAAQGTKVNLVIKSTGGRRRLKIAIPPGVQDGLRMVVKGGGKGAGAARGHLYITIRLQD
jgi:DnaJ-class molecular chaperone